MKTFNGHPVSDHLDLDHGPTIERLRKRLETFPADFDYKAHFGQDCTLDLVKYTTWTPPCGCTVSYVWRADTNETERVHIGMHSHEFCNKHTAHNGNPHAHFKALEGG